MIKFAFEEKKICKKKMLLVVIYKQFENIFKKSDVYRYLAHNYQAWR